MPSQIKKTNDGSDSLVSEHFGELYHSFHGSMQEANHIFIQNGLAQIAKKEINIFEMGFGSGLNAILSYYYAKKHNLKLNYYTIEAYPVDASLAAQLNYNDFIQEANFDAVFSQMHQLPWNEMLEIAPFFKLKKIKGNIENIDLGTFINTKFDIIYYDAFAPTVQEYLWETPVLKKMYQILNEKSFLITYCAKGIFKRTLKSLSFEVIPLEGPIGKREITKAIK